MIFDFKNGCKMNLRIITKYHTADPEIGFLAQSISKLYARATAMPPSWELKILMKSILNNFIKNSKIFYGKKFHRRLRFSLSIKELSQIFFHILIPSL